MLRKQFLVQQTYLEQTSLRINFIRRLVCFKFNSIFDKIS